MWSQIINTLGLGLDIIGVSLLALDILLETPRKNVAIVPKTPEEIEKYEKLNPEFKHLLASANQFMDERDHEFRGIRFAKLGLGFAVVGFALQIAANWIWA